MKKVHLFVCWVRSGKLLACILFAWGWGCAPGSLAQDMRVATFRCDVTVPLGHALMAGGIKPAETIADPLFAHGIVLLGSGEPVVMVAVDWCEIRNQAYEDWRDTLARAAGTTSERVLISCGHQHEAPVVDYRAQELLDEQGLPGALCDVAWAKRTLGNVAQALKDAVPMARRVTHYGCGEARVQEVASNRRVMQPDGSVVYHRGSATKTAEFRAQPAGVIDEKVRALSFWDEDMPVAAVFSYATHPMSYYGTGEVSVDFVGMARESFASSHDGLFTVYFSGCSGDVTAGKYNDGAKENRVRLAERLEAGMQGAWRETRRWPLHKISVSVAKLRLVAKEQGFAALRDETAPVFQRNLAAMGLSWTERLDRDSEIDVPAVHVGHATFIQMPAESFVEYQLYAQGLTPDRFVVVAAYAECAPGYIPTSRAGVEGFHQESWCWVAPGSEIAMWRAIGTAVRP